MFVSAVRALGGPAPGHWVFNAVILGTRVSLDGSQEAAQGFARTEVRGGRQGQQEGGVACKCSTYTLSANGPFKESRDLKSKIHPKAESCSFPSLLNS